ncbi:alpha/beta fold hydrolase [Rhodosalinus sediminis]|uniref:Alpha/beta fold hydrolase n=1 Tax=Rhodosalinus sediminis TaxID=1940533 RepID=A0A3D9BVK6_9RHOB|nr:alpha/beta hydrolase [Rhodosalinus sediminis]REC57563.1 alpha/beta fold hydrolase [Rhodosalinus sediminis]
MTLIRVDAVEDRPQLHGLGEAPGALLAEAVRGTRGPVVVMIHGYKFVPGHPVRCPHRHILGLEARRDCWKAVSWPRALGFAGASAEEGLGLAFGWHARGTLWEAWRRAEAAGVALAQVVEVLRAAAPVRPVHVVAHSLGARVALAAMTRAAEGAFGRVLLLAGAEFAGAAEAALAAPGGRGAELVNVASRENLPFDLMLEALIAPARPGDVTLGRGLAPGPRRATLRLDDARTLAALAGRGFRVAPPARRICHWSAYLRPGALDLYRALLRAPERVPLAALATASGRASGARAPLPSPAAAPS